MTEQSLDELGPVAYVVVEWYVAIGCLAGDVISDVGHCR